MAVARALRARAAGAQQPQGTPRNQAVTRALRAQAAQQMALQALARAEALMEEAPQEAQPSQEAQLQYATGGARAWEAGGLRIWKLAKLNCMGCFRTRASVSVRHRDRPSP